MLKKIAKMIKLQEGVDSLKGAPERLQDLLNGSDDQEDEEVSSSTKSKSEDTSPDEAEDTKELILVSLDEIDEEFYIRSSLVDEEEAVQKINQWVDGQDRFWPDELTTQVLTSEIKKIYVPYWYLSGKASCNYKVRLGTNYEEYETCSTCRGKGSYKPLHKDKIQKCALCNATGKVVKTKTKWEEKSGRIATSRFDNIKNIHYKLHEILPKIECVENNFEINRKLLDEELSGCWSKSVEKSIHVLKPQGTSDSHKRRIFTEEAREKLRDRVKFRHRSYDEYGIVHISNMKIGNYVSWDKTPSEVGVDKGDEYYICNGRLYPVYFSEYVYNEEKYFAQVDGITGNPLVETPWKVKAKRIAVYTLITLILVAGAYGLGSMLNWW